MSTSRSPSVPEADADEAVRAAERIGRAVDEWNGGRLKGDGPPVSAERSLPATPRKIFGKASHFISLSHLLGPEYSLSISGDPLAAEVGNELWGRSHRARDQITGRLGAIRTAWITCQPPMHYRRAWNWIRRDGTRGPSQLIPGIEILERDSMLTVTIVRQAQTGPSTIFLEHAGIPAAWAKDMQCYWEFQLALLSHLLSTESSARVPK